VVDALDVLDVPDVLGVELHVQMDVETRVVVDVLRVQVYAVDVVVHVLMAVVHHANLDAQDAKTHAQDNVEDVLVDVVEHVQMDVLLVLDVQDVLDVVTLVQDAEQIVHLAVVQHVLELAVVDVQDVQDAVHNAQDVVHHVVEHVKIVAIQPVHLHAMVIVQLNVLEVLRLQFKNKLYTIEQMLYSVFS